MQVYRKSHREFTDLSPSPPPFGVQVYRKSYREFTDLRLVQQLGGHQGVVWTMKFSRNGRFLASGGSLAITIFPLFFFFFFF